MPLTDDFLREAELGSEFLWPIKVYFCRDCRLVQTLHDVDVRDYYRDYQYSVAISPFAQRFMRRLAEEIWEQYDLKSGSAVVEVGSGDGAQLGYFRKMGARVFGFEPSASLARVARQKNIPVSERLFSEEAFQEVPADMQPADVILLTYTFDHLPDPLTFLNVARKALDPLKGILVIEVHDLAKIVERREFCLFEHEHTSYYTAETLQATLQRADLDLIDVMLVPEEERRGNSLLAVATPRGSALSARALPPIRLGFLDSLEAYLAFGDAVQKSIARLREFVRDRRRVGKRLAGYGAGGRGVMTLAAVAQPNDFAYVCDQNPAFHGWYTPGAHVLVDSPSRLLSDPVDEVVVFSFGYFNEIYNDLREFRARGGRLDSLLAML
jgi:SAM-dependent methyltransferase